MIVIGIVRLMLGGGILVSREPRVDAYIAKAPPFARPILEHVRERVHAAVPDVEEAMKWSAPASRSTARSC